MIRDHFPELVDHWLNGELDDAEHAELQEALRDDPTFRSEFIRMTNLDSGLRDLGAATVPFPTAQSARRQFSLPQPWEVAASLALAAALLWIFLSPSEKSSDDQFATTQDSSPEQIAVLTGQSGAVWKTVGAATPDEGTSFGSGSRLVLEEGLAQIDFFGGASVSLSAPVEIELISRDSAILHRGRIKAEVPPAARGFEIKTADVLLHDLGTSFGLVVGEEGGADLVVFDGEVRATGGDGKEVTLLGGDSARFDGDEKSEVSLVGQEAFPDISKVFAGAGNRAEAELAKWTEASLDLRRDPRLVAYYDFENLTLETRRLRNRAPGDTPSELDGGIVGAKVTEGRWPGKGALDFRREGDRVRFQIPGEFDALTLFAWVRIDALDRNLNSLFLTDYFDENEIHWQVSREGSLNFATSPMGVVDITKHNRRFFSDSFWDPRQSGEWFFLATTVDRAPAARNGVGVVHYVNGKPLGISKGTQMDKPLPRMRIGEADLGNWSDPIWPEAGIRTLNGRIDEFGIFGEALSAGEIQSLYQTGKP